jgi:8-oxo-dGTP pyrophosphatase MutT (NUDIX family)
MKYSACVLIERDGLFLGVSRKDNPNDFGLPGGKMDPGETIAECAKRECLEETGYTASILDLNYAYVAVDGEYEVSTFHAIQTNASRLATNAEETSVVKWVTADELINSYFGEYNAQMLKHFGYVKEYLIYYTGCRSKTLPDVVFAKDSTEACKKFIRDTMGICNIVKCEEVK